jgi:hypothetical protein
VTGYCQGAFTGTSGKNTSFLKNNPIRRCLYAYPTIGAAVGFSWLHSGNHPDDFIIAVSRLIFPFAYGNLRTS